MENVRRVALVTGAARRIGACIATTLHREGFDVVIHCRHSRDAADALADALNTQRPDSARVVVADLQEPGACEKTREAVMQWRNRLDLLVNNASTFQPTPIDSTTRAQWNAIVDSNLAAPFFLAQAFAPCLQESRGSIVNLVDIHAWRPMPGHAVYSSAKAGLEMLTRSLALELAPRVRVNGVAPGAILWPESGANEKAQQDIIEATPLKRIGTPEDIAETVVFLATSAFITAQVIAVDGGRSGC